MLLVGTTRLSCKNLKFKIYKTTVMPVVLYGCEIWYLILLLNYGMIFRPRVFENMVLVGLDPRGMRMGSQEGSTMRNPKICTAHLI